MKQTVFLLLLAAVLFMSGCATPSRTVQRTAADEQIDLSGRWNDTDSRLVAEEMIDDVLARPWLGRFESSSGRAPVVIVGEVRNLSSEHIDTTPFIRDIERELINSGMVRFVAGDRVRDQLRTERMDQQTQAREETVSRLGAETGADFMLSGTISSTTDAIEGLRAVAYSVNMDLINIESAEIVWIGNKEIKKLIEQRRSRW